MDMSQYLDIFMEESKEHLQNMNDILMKLENTPQEINLLNEIFRIAHTLKGMAGTMGFNNITNLTHEMENVLDSLRSQSIHINPEVINLLFECFDELEKYIYHIEQKNNEGDLDSEELIKKLKNFKDTKSNEAITKEEIGMTEENVEVKVNEYVDAAIQKAIMKNLNAYLIKVELSKKCMLKSARAYIVINILEQISEIIYSAPSIEDIEDEKFDFSFELIIVTENHRDAIIKDLNNISELESIAFIDLNGKNYAIEGNKQQDDDRNNHDEGLAPQVDSIDFNSDILVQKKEDDVNKRARTGKTVRVDIDRLDNLMNLVSELIIIKTRLEDIEDTEKRQGMNEATEHLERITTSLHDAVMKVRMVPIERVFNRFPRMVRDVSKDLNKEIALMMSGADTEVDRTVIDEIGDPLIHLIRNAIDHGIEDIETRLKRNKKKEGTVKLVAYPDGNSVVIEVEDDGGGIDIEKVRGKAIEKGIITLKQSQMMEETEIIQLLFHSGFSTAEKVSDISGRGVGLDVVKNKIESLGGTVEIVTEKKKGSKFVIRLPLTLAIIQALLVNLGDEKYAIPLNNIKEITTISSQTIRKVQNNEVVLFRNTTLPILRLGKLLDVSNTVEATTELTVVIVKKGDKTIGLIVDDLIGQQEIVIKSLGKFLANIKGIAGATILGNGSVALIVDTNSFF